MDEALIAAPRVGVVGAIRSLIDAGANVNTRGADGQTALMHAANGHHIPAMYELIKAGADMEVVVDPNGTSRPLLLDLTERVNLRAMRVFLESGANVNANDYADSTALILAARKSVLCVRLLLEHGADVNALDRSTLETPLKVAAEGGSAAMVKVLLDTGADVNECGGMQENSPLMGAAAKGQADNIHVLVAAGAPVDYVNKRGETALMLACDTLRVRAMQALLESGASPNAVDTAGDSVLHHAFFRMRIDPLTLEQLLQHGANVNYVSLNGLTALDDAVRNDDSAAVDQLLRAGADIKMSRQSTQASALVQRYLLSFNGKASMDGGLRWMRRRAAIQAWHAKWESSKPQSFN